MSNNNTSAGVWVKASERLPNNPKQLVFIIHRGNKIAGRFEDGTMWRGEHGWNDFDNMEWLDESPFREPGEGVKKKGIDLAAMEAKFTKLLETETVESFEAFLNTHPSFTAPEKAPALREEGKEEVKVYKVDDLQHSVREHIKQHNLFDWHEALTENEMIYLENLLLTFCPLFPPGSIGYEKQRKHIASGEQRVGEKEVRWVKASERLPGESKNYFVKVWSGRHKYIYHDCNYFDKGTWDTLPDSIDEIREWLDESAPSVAGSVEERAKAYIIRAYGNPVDPDTCLIARDSYLAGAAESNVGFAIWVSENGWSKAIGEDWWNKSFSPEYCQPLTTSELYNGPYQEYLKQLNK